MDHDQFMRTVGHALGGDETSAERPVRATLATLGERIGRDEARHLVSLLPPQLGGWLFSPGAAAGFGVDEFVRRVAERQQVDPATAELHARVVFTVLGQAIPDEEFAHLQARLPKQFASLLPKGPSAAAPAAQDFVAGVAEPAGVDVGTAERVTDAVLRTLAERIAPGNVDLLISRLPVALHRPLTEGKAGSTDRTRVMTLEQFLGRVAERANVAPEEAEHHGRAVFAMLRDAVGRDEIVDIDVQLPDEYHRLLLHA